MGTTVKWLKYAERRRRQKIAWRKENTTARNRKRERALCTASDLGVGILLEASVEDGVRDLIAKLI